jgi:hypothetical protein
MLRVMLHIISIFFFKSNKKKNIKDIDNYLTLLLHSVQWVNLEIFRFNILLSLNLKLNYIKIVRSSQINHFQDNPSGRLKKY